MIATTSFGELLEAKQALEYVKSEEPIYYKRFVQVLQLTRQLQYKFQYMCSLLVDEDPGRSRPVNQNEYVLQLYQEELTKLKRSTETHAIKHLLMNYHRLGYANICRLALGANPKVLVGPSAIR
ncbi:hypothetical protein DX933_12610 [Ornithinibacillus gellani]|uniref:hypothetical protein n=1 Tax=Ornithinibacillus gellani TaxID=2293253 RepID=UPI000F486BD1|nr:hypothetical protein [Ornithinibacillus gellani]TQS74162.1 hypothetical protein DX933_12610 [Ornithinibacillus gellani]